MSVNIVSAAVKAPSFGRVLDFGNAFLWTWDQKVTDQRIKVVVIGESARRTSDLARNLRIFINRVHAELLANEYGLTAIEAELRRARTYGEVSEVLRKLQAFEMRIRALIRRIERSISALCRRRSAERRIPTVHSVLETIWDWRVDTVLDRYELLRERAARLHATLASSPTGGRSRVDVLSTFSNILSPPLNVFISYRRDDSRDLVGRMSDFLERGELNFRIFRDLGSIEPGSDWRSEIEHGIRQAHLFLAILGPNWAWRSELGRVRIADADDWVRYELESAFNLKKDIIPVVVQGTIFPPRDLPDTLRPLARIQPFILDPSSGFDQSMKYLVKMLQSFQRGRRYLGTAR